MPKYLISIIILTISTWTGAVYIFLRIPPQKSRTFILFLTSILFALETTLSLAIYPLWKFFAPAWKNPRQILRDSFKLALLPSLGSCTFLLLRYEGIDNFIITGALILFISSAEILLAQRL